MARREPHSAVRYQLDPRNRLVIADPDEALQPRRIVQGRFRVDRRHGLIYEARTSPERDGHPGPHQVVLDGTWTLSPRHELGLAIRERHRRARQTLFLKGVLLEARANALVVSLERVEPDGRRSAQRLTLFGRWQADAGNRLTFLVERADGAEDRLTFDGAWTLDTRHQLLYRYQVPHARGRGETTQTLRFAGVWEVPGASRLVYRLDVSSRSAFVFRAALQSRSLNARQGRLAYQVGIELSGGRTVHRSVILFGVWKLHRDLSVSFEIPYASGRRQALRFRGTYTFKRRNTLTVELSDQRDKPLGLSVTFSRKMLGDAELFLRLQQSEEGREALAGVQVRF